MNIDTEQSVALVNQQQFYVSLSRAQHDARIFTNQHDALAQVVSRSWPKATAIDAVLPFVDERRYEHRQDQEKNRNVAQQHMQRRLEWRRTPPVSLLPHQFVPSLVQGQHQRDTALLVSHRQRDWRRERQQPVPEQTVARSPTELREELLSQTLRREEAPEQKLERRWGIRYTR